MNAIHSIQLYTQTALSLKAQWNLNTVFLFSMLPNICISILGIKCYENKASKVSFLDFIQKHSGFIHHCFPLNIIYSGTQVSEKATNDALR